MAAHLLTPGLATGVGSLPHLDASAAAALVLRHLPDLPVAPQLPGRTPLEGMLAQWARGVPGVVVAPDGGLRAVPESASDPVTVAFDDDAHGGLLRFLDLAAAAPRPPARVKVQVTGPLTLALAFLAAGADPAVAFRRGPEAAIAWARALEELVTRRLPGAALHLWFDEPGLVVWNRGPQPPVERDAAVDILSGALASLHATTGVHVCGDGDARLAIESGPAVVAVPVRNSLVDDAPALGRHLEGGGWIAWGAVPTDRPVGESADPLWRRLVELWCELTRRGCDPVALRDQAIVTPACGLAGHGASQAELALRLTREVGARVHDQAAATRLTVGA